MEALLALGALTPEGDISRPLGEQMAMFPVDPKFAKCLITAQVCFHMLLSSAPVLKSSCLCCWVHSLHSHTVPDFPPGVWLPG